MNIPLYVIAADYRQAADILAEIEVDESAVQDTLAALSGELTAKATNIAMLVRNLETTAQQIQAAEKQMATRRQKIAKRAARLRQYLCDALQHAGVYQVSCPYFKLAVRENPVSVAVDDATRIPAAFLRQPEPSPPMPDKARLKQALQNGQGVPGCRLMRGQRLDIQ